MTNFRFISKLILLLAFVLPTMLYAQKIITTSGGEGSGTTGSVTYTVGQVVNNTYSTVSGSVVEGVQQPFEISVETGVEIADINVTIKAFPNPSADYLTILIENFKTENLTYMLFSIDGKLHASGKITGSETNIKMNDLIPAVYFLKVSKNDKDIKIFKIIKN
jgi:hypothetical protein